jgi:hypothetical protein
MIRRIRARRAERKQAKSKEAVFRKATTELTAEGRVVNNALTFTSSEDESDNVSLASPSSGFYLSSVEQVSFSTKVQILEESIRKKDAAMEELKEIYNAAITEKDEVIGTMSKELETTRNHLLDVEKEVSFLTEKHQQEVSALEKELELQRDDIKETKHKLHIVSAELMNIQFKYYEVQEENHLQNLAEFGRDAARGFLNLISF